MADVAATVGEVDEDGVDVTDIVLDVELAVELEVDAGKILEVDVDVTVENEVGVDEVVVKLLVEVVDGVAASDASIDVTSV